MVNVAINGMEVILGELFSKELKNFPQSDRLLIHKFIWHIQNFGFTNLEGRKDLRTMCIKMIRTLPKK